MIAHNIMVRFPDICFVIPHTGSFLPFMYQRMKGVSKILAMNGLMDETNVDIISVPFISILQGILNPTSWICSFR